MKFFLAAVMGLFSVVAKAQVPAYFFRHDIPVLHGPDTLKLAWSGGLNSPQFSKIDLNFDGTEDLFVFDRTHHHISTFVAEQAGGNWQWRPAPEYAAAFPPGLFNWVLLRDYDNDGRPDLFTFTVGGGRVFRNISTPQNGLQWELVVPVLYYNTTSNINISSSDIPAIEDIDNDGDLDILMVTGARVSFMRNQSMETTGMPGIGNFIRETDSWGGIRECGCASFLFGPNVSCRMAGPGSENTPQLHGGASLLALDLDADQDKDLLWGDFLCKQLAELENLGSPANASMTGFNINFPANTQPVNDLLFPAAYYADVNFDGLKDLVVAGNTSNGLGDTVVNFAQSVWLYHNTGSNAAPQFSFQQTDFLQNQMLDRGEGANPAFADIDGDGDLDMLLGNYYGRTATGARATLALYTNTGTITNPAFYLANPDYLNLSGYNFMNVRPGFTDLNGDGALDIYLTSTHFSAIPYTGRVRYFLNTASTGQAMAFGTMQVLDNTLTATVDDLPVFFDVDSDGQTDMLVAKGTGAVEYYRNTASNTSPSYQLVTNSYGGFTVSFYRRKPSLAIADADADGLPDLISADDSSTVRIYSNFRAQTAPFAYTQEFVYDSTTNTRKAPHLGRRLHVTAADLDGDTYPEIVVGTQAGGLYMLSRTSTINATPAPQAAWPVQVFPNPAQNQVQVISTEPVTVAVLDVLGRQTGQKLSMPYATEHELDLSTWVPGVYFLRLETTSGKVQVKRLVVAR